MQDAESQLQETPVGAVVVPLCSFAADLHLGYLCDEQCVLLFPLLELSLKKLDLSWLQPGKGSSCTVSNALLDTWKLKLTC